MRGVIAWALLGVTACGPPPGPAEAPQLPVAAKPEPAEAPGDDAEFASREDYERRTRGLVEKLATLGFPIEPDALKVVVVQDEAARKHLERQMAVTTPEARLEGMATVRRLFGFKLGTSARELRELAVLGMLSGAHAYYDFVDKQLIFRNQPLAKLIDLDYTVSHELVHAYQDQTGAGLQAFFQRHGETQDQAQAARAIAEGQAVLVSSALMMKQQGNDIAKLDPELRNDAQGRLLSGEGLNALYSAGYRFMLERFKRGGFEEVRRLFSDPPASMEQVLHPEKFQKDAPQSVALPDWPKKLGEARSVHSDTLGELLIYLLLVEAEVPFTTASLVATGWDGDRYAAYQLGDGKRALLWRSVWDRPADAEAFEKALLTLFGEKPKTSAVVRSKTVVDVVFSEQTELRPALAALMKSHRGRFDADPADASSTQAAEAKVSKLAALEPRIEGGYWVYPEFSIKVPVLEGWRLVNIRGAEALAGQVHEGLADNITVVVDQDLVDGNLAKYLDQNEQLISRTPTQRVLTREIRTLAGKQTGILDVHITTGKIRMKARAYVIPRPGRFVIVQLGVHEDRWQQAQATLEAIEKNLVIGD